MEQRKETTRSPQLMQKKKKNLKNKRPNQKVGQRTKQTFLQRRHTDG